MFSYRVQLFAVLREMTGEEFWSIESQAPLSGSALLQCFFDTHSQLSGLQAVTRLAVNCQFAEEDSTLKTSDELALIPPVSGG